MFECVCSWLDKSFTTLMCVLCRNDEYMLVVTDMTLCVSASGLNEGNRLLNMLNDIPKKLQK